MPIGNFEEIMKIDIQKDEEDVKKESLNNEKNENPNLEIEKIREELESKRNQEYDLSTNLPSNTKIDVEQFKEYHKGMNDFEAENSLPAERREIVNNIKQSMDLTKAVNISLYGSKSQEKISDYSKSILDKTKAKDSGEVGVILTELMVNVKSTDIKPESEKGFLEKIFSKPKNQIEILKAKQDTVEAQLEIISAKLVEARYSLLKDIEVLDKLYDENIKYYNNLNNYIIAGKEILYENNNIIIPQMLEEANKISEDGEKSKAVQQIRDYQANVNRFEKRIHDLEVSKVISMQMMPQLKLIQENDSLLADKIQGAVNNTIPLWRTQFVIALSLDNQTKNAKLSNQISEASDDLIRRNSERLKQSTVEIKKEAEKSIVSMDALQEAQSNFIDTINETLAIEEAARKSRKDAEGKMRDMELELREALLKNVRKRDQMNNLSLSKLEENDDMKMITGE